MKRQNWRNESCKLYEVRDLLNGFLASQSTWPRASILVERIGEWMGVPIKSGGSGKPEPHQFSSIGFFFLLWYHKGAEKWSDNRIKAPGK